MRLLALCLVAVLAACHHPGGTRTLLVPEPPQTGDAHAQARYREALQRFQADGRATDAFGAIVRDYPNDPIVPWAELYDGIAAVKARDFQRARDVLGKVVTANADAALTLRAQLFLAIADNYTGDQAAARPLIAMLASHKEAIASEEERTEYLAAAAYSIASGDKPLDALPIFDDLWGRVSPAEQSLIADRVESIVGVASREALQDAHDRLPRHDGIAMALVAGHLAEHAAAAGDARTAARFRDEAAPLRAALGLPRTPAPAEVPDAGSGAGVIGAILPLNISKEQRIAQGALEAFGLVAGAATGSGIAPIEIRPAADPNHAALAVDDLARARVVGLVGPLEEAMVGAAATRAETLGIPLVSLASRPETTGAPGHYVFHVVHSAEMRARALADRAADNGIARFAILAPETGYGRAVAKAFEAEVGKRGGSVVATAMYSTTTPSFDKVVSKLPKTGWDAIFIPDKAGGGATDDRLARVLPALATWGAYPKPLGTKKVVDARPILVLSTAEGLDAEFVANTGRYSEGAWLAPGFYADPTDAAAKPFVDRYTAAFGQPPQAIEAYAYDAAMLVAAASAGGRGALATKLSTGSFDGVTGAIRFDPQSHLRADPGVIYTVVEDAGVYAIHRVP